MSTVAYARVSTDKQDAANQHYEIESYLARQKTLVTLDRFVEETISGKRSVAERKLGELLKELRPGDMLVVSETSRISRRLVDVLNTIQLCIDRGITLVAVKENYMFGDDINSKVIAFAFGLAAEIERNLISARTKEALARKKSEGMKLGRPAGTYHAHHYKLYGKDDQIRPMLMSGVSVAAIARFFNVNRETMRRFIADNDLRSNSTM